MTCSCRQLYGADIAAVTAGAHNDSDTDGARPSSTLSSVQSISLFTKSRANDVKWTYHVAGCILVSY